MRIFIAGCAIALASAQAFADEAAMLNDLEVKLCTFDEGNRVFSFLPSDDGGMGVMGIEADTVTVSGDTKTVIEGTRIYQFQPDNVRVLDGATLQEAPCNPITKPVVALLGQIVSPDIGGDIALMLENQRSEIARMKAAVAAAERQSKAARTAQTAADIARVAVEKRLERTQKTLEDTAARNRSIKQDMDIIQRRNTKLKADNFQLRIKLGLPPTPIEPFDCNSAGDCDE